MPPTVEPSDTLRLVTDIGGPRIRVRPVAGLPLVHVETPRYEGFKRFAKRGLDVAITTTAETDAQAEALLRALGFPLATEEQR